MEWSVILAAALAIGGWYVAHALSGRRDTANKRRELRLQYLIEAYRRIERVANQGVISSDLAPELERAIADVQLFGSARQVGLVQSFANDFSQTGHGNPSDLLVDLRQDLRKELQLEAVPPNRILFLRFPKNKPQG